MIDFLKSAAYERQQDEELEKQMEAGVAAAGNAAGSEEEAPADGFEDELIPKAIELALEYEQISSSMLMRRLKIGYARAARLVDQLELKEIVSPADGNKPRQILITQEDYRRMFGKEGEGMNERKVGVVSLGCSKNRVDTELMLGKLREAGYTFTAQPAEADVILVNTCGFIESAKQESIDTILEMAQYKETGKLKALIVSGCLSGRYRGGILAENLPEVDAFLGVTAQDEIVAAVEKALGGERTEQYHAAEVSGDYANRLLTTPGYYAYVKIAEGCNNRCSYCAIPYIRGNLKSRPMPEIVEEVANAGGARRQGSDPGRAGYEQIRPGSVQKDHAFAAVGAIGCGGGHPLHPPAVLLSGRRERRIVGHDLPP